LFKSSIYSIKISLLSNFENLALPSKIKETCQVVVIE
jgi:hypothetical protein